ncbi:hypothetical protein [Halalkalicoccus salilacus]|uniref:hypothetical protein n=1 Tax=Halalkalicoccus TaxID=332246 RepID=UPI00360D7D9E
MWLWRGFDTTPLADHVALTLRFRSMLAKHLFEEGGENCWFFKVREDPMSTSRRR